MKKYITHMMVMALLALPLGLSLQAGAATEPDWDVTGNYVVNMEYQGTDYAHDVSLQQDGSGDLTGSGGFPAGGPHTYTWEIVSGSVEGSNISFTAHYTASADAVTPLTVLEVEGVIAEDGTISGTWSDNYQGGERSGMLTTVSGVAEELAHLVAEDFNVVDYQVSPELGTLAGYSAGFGLYDSFSFADAESVVVRLYGAGDQLLQTNTMIQFPNDHQITAPFDVSGDFDYVEDGYWTNVRQAEYGQSVPAVKVVATVTLEDGQVLTATNTALVGDPTTIYPETPPAPTAPANKDQCKKGGWMTFTNPSFKNQGQCVSSVNH